MADHLSSIGVENQDAIPSRFEQAPIARLGGVEIVFRVFRVLACDDRHREIHGLPRPPPVIPDLGDDALGPNSPALRALLALLVACSFAGRLGLYLSILRYRLRLMRIGLPRTSFGLSRFIAHRSIPRLPTEK